MRRTLALTLALTCASTTIASRLNFQSDRLEPVWGAADTPAAYRENVASGSVSEEQADEQLWLEYSSGQYNEKQKSAWQRLRDALALISNAEETLTEPTADDAPHHHHHPHAENEHEQGWPHPPPPPVLDLKEYTILEILEAALNHTCPDHDEDGEMTRECHYEATSVTSLLIVVHLAHTDGWPPKRPDGPPKPPKADPHKLPLHRLAWLVSRSPAAKEALAKKDITLLAPDDWALAPEHRRGPTGHESEHRGPPPPPPPHFDVDMLPDGFELSESAQHPFRQVARALRHADKSDDDDEETILVGDQAWNRTEVIQFIIGYVTKYHTLDGAYPDAHVLADKSTVSTLLGPSQRVRLSGALTHTLPPRPTLRFNFYSDQRGPTVLAKNGVIRLVSKPLLPPFSPLTQLFLYPQAFSTLTSSVQRVGLADALLRASEESNTVEDDLEDVSADTLLGELLDEYTASNDLHPNTPEFTIFSPTNGAFARLGMKLVALLESPFPISKRILVSRSPSIQSSPRCRPTAHTEIRPLVPRRPWHLVLLGLPAQRHRHRCRVGQARAICPRQRVRRRLLRPAWPLRRCIRER